MSLREAARPHGLQQSGDFTLSNISHSSTPNMYESDARDATNGGCGHTTTHTTTHKITQSQRQHAYNK